MGNSLKFTIVEKRNLSEIYDDFKKGFLNPNKSLKQLKKELDLSKTEYDDLRQRVLSETGLKKKPTKRNSNKIITDSTYLHHNSNNKYTIVKSIEGELKYFGQYNSKEQAIKARNELIKNNWGVDYEWVI